MSKNSGYENAYTTLSDTVYSFDIANEYFDEALDRFSQFFISPLFHPDSVSWEIEAIESEF